MKNRNILLDTNAFDSGETTYTSTGVIKSGVNNGPLVGSIAVQTTWSGANAGLISDYDRVSNYLLRELNVTLYNANKESIVLKGAKITVSGSKFIGIQQDNFTVQLNNINYALLANALTKGYRYINISIEQKGESPTRVFTGEIRLVNVGKSSAIEREVEFVCLTRVSDMLANLVVPITMASSINGWSVWEALEQLDSSVGYAYGSGVSFDPSLRETLDSIIIYDQAYSAQKSPVGIVEDLISLANEHRLPGGKSAWFDYKLSGTDEFGGGVISIFDQTTGLQGALEIGPETGLLDAPTISDLEISFNHIYVESLVPGRVVKLNNAWISTMGNDSAFVWAWDPNHLYVITEARYSLSNYPSRFTVSVRARSYSKYRNFTSTNKIYEESGQ